MKPTARNTISYYAEFMALSATICLLPTATGLIFRFINVAPSILFYGSLLVFFSMTFFCLRYFLISHSPRLHEDPFLQKKLLILFLTIGVFIFVMSRVLVLPSFFLGYLVSGNLIFGGMVFGCWLVKGLSRPAELFPVCITMSLADIFSVLMGPSREIVNDLESFYTGLTPGPAPLGDFLLIKMMVPGNLSPIPLFGISDWIVMVFLSAAAYKFRINDNLIGASLNSHPKEKKVLPYLPLGGLGLFIAIVAAWQLNLFLPALPILNAFFLTFIFVVHPEARKLTSMDWKIISLAIATVALFFLVFRG